MILNLYASAPTGYLYISPQQHTKLGHGKSLFIYLFYFYSAPIQNLDWFKTSYFNVWIARVSAYQPRKKRPNKTLKIKLFDSYAIMQIVVVSCTQK